MERMAAKILKELLAGERDLPARRGTTDEREAAADHWTRPILLERGAYLAKLARYGEGSATETIREYAQHSAMLSFWSRDSDAEMDANCACLFYVLDGRGTLVSGGGS